MSHGKKLILIENFKKSPKNPDLLSKIMLYHVLHCTEVSHKINVINKETL